MPEIQVKASASSGLISYDRSRSWLWTSLWFCLCSFNQLLFNINFEFFSDPVRLRTSILTLFGMAHDPYIRIVSILMLWLLRQYKISLRLHPDLIFMISFFQEWRSYLIQTLLVLSITRQARIPSLNSRWLFWLVTVQSSMFILMILRLRIQHLKLMIRPRASLPLSDFPRPILLSIRSLKVLLMHHVCFEDRILLLLVTG